MTARVFISYRTSDGADKATALARDLEGLFGSEQVFLDKEDLAPGARWRDEIARALTRSPILIVLVTPNYFGAVDANGQRCVDRDDDPARDELRAGIAAGATIIPLLCDGVTATPAAADLPQPFGQLCELQWGRLRAFDWRQDMARLADDLRHFGLAPRADASGAAAPRSGSGPLSLAGAAIESANGDAPASNHRRAWLGGLAVAVLGAGAWGAWRWQRERAANLSGQWRARIGARGATTARDGELLLVTLEHKGRDLRLASSALDIERDPDWQNYRDFWRQRTGTDLRRVFYRGEGKVIAEDESEDPSDEPASPGRKRSAGGALVGPSPGPVAVRRVVVAIHIAAPGGAAEPIDTGAFHGTVDADDQHIHGRLWLNSEQAERIVELRRAS